MSEIPSNSFLDEDPFFAEILSSQSDIEDQISMLKDVLDSDRCIEDKTNELQHFLSSNSIKNVPVDILDEKVFHFSLTNAQKLYFEVIKSINETVKNKNRNIVEDVRNQLNIVINLLKCWDSCITHIKGLEKISVIDVKSFPPILFDVMIDVITHCKTSSINYGDCFQSVSEILASLFRHSVGTLHSFYALLDTVILFDTTQEEEMNILLKIIDETGKIATLASGMDAKTLADMWKHFGKLSANYCMQMKGISPSTVTYHFKGLAESIVAILTSISQKNVKSLNERSILCSRLLLKILEKLSDAYCGWIRNDVMLGIIIMMTNLFRYTEQCLKITTYNADFIKFIVSNFTFMIEPFLDITFKNEAFKLAFFEHGRNIKDDAIGYHLLCLTVIKKISGLPYETQKDWCAHDNNIMDICFQNVDKMKRDICLGKLKVQMSRDVAQGTYMTNIYEATCLSIFSLVCQVTAIDFDNLVMLLLKYLLNGNFFSALLSSDVWCFVCRLGSSDMCYDHFKYLMQVHEILEERKDNFNVIILSNLICRQYKFLSDKDKADFIENIKKTNDPYRWKYVARILNVEKIKQIQQQLDALSINAKVITDLKKLEEIPSLANLTDFMKDLELIESSNVPQDEQSIDAFIKMWNKIVYMLGECEGTLLLLLENLALSILRATNPHGHPKYMTTVLESIASLYPYATSKLHYEFCRFFDRCASELTDSDSNIVAEIFCRLLNDQDPCIQQAAFESFENLTRECPNANLLSSVAMAIKNAESEVSKTLPAYISGEVIHDLFGFTNLDEFFVALAEENEKVKHVCHQRTHADREEKVQKMNDDDFGTPEDTEKKADKICNDMETILKFKSQLKRETCERLRNICLKFLDSGDR